MIVRFHIEARLEFLELTDFYRQKSNPLGVEFVREVERILLLIKDYSQIGTPWNHGTRRLPLRRFPFNLIYRLNDDFVLIVAIAHRRRKDYWSWRV
ncbi:MAG: type II toxin-antitoxin system RelE/ParE family toxin [Candidatus Methylumidiphilus sp.]